MLQYFKRVGQYERYSLQAVLVKKAYSIREEILKDNRHNWFVITGAPSSGKTTLLKALEKRGYHVEYEVARAFIDAELKKGVMLAEIRKDEFEFQKTILQLKIELELKLSKDKLIFFERGIPDSAAYFTLLNVSKESIPKLAHELHYKRVFLLELLDYQTDYARVENEENARLLEKLLYEEYTQLGFQVICVPVIPVEERIKFILKNVYLIS